MFNRGKLFSGVAAVGIYFLLIFLVLYHYNVHNQKAKNYVEKNSNRVTVTLVNSDTTVLNRSDKVNAPSKPVSESKPIPVAPITPPPVPKKTPVKQSEPKQNTERQAAIKEQQRRQAEQRQAAEREKRRQAQVAQENRRKEQARQQAIADKKLAEERRLARIAADKKKETARQQAEAKKEREAQRRIAAQEAKKKKEAEEAKRRQEQERQRLAAQEAKKKKEAEARRRQEEEAKKRRQAQDLFANVNTQEPVKKTPQSNPQPNRVKHTSTAADRIRNTQQSGQVSDKNRERGIENAYIAKVKRHLNNWSAQSNYKGSRATIRLIISSSGRFRYTIQSSTSGAMSAGLRQFLDQLNRMGLGTHTKSTPYDIKVNFTAR
ncbi:MAG TPA: cell envelope integrity protein TolA [Campylobacterales bacterium]|nr:cell envelope integrity protein TolA [Campylobacterales bacterium]